MLSKNNLLRCKFRFILRGFTKEELQELYLLIKVNGWKEQKKKLFIGHILLAGKQGR